MHAHASMEDKVLLLLQCATYLNPAVWPSWDCDSMDCQRCNGEWRLPSLEVRFSRILKAQASVRQIHAGRRWLQFSTHCHAAPSPLARGSMHGQRWGQACIDPTPTRPMQHASPFPSTTGWLEACNRLK
jgi:hypothetical protein